MRVSVERSPAGAWIQVELDAAQARLVAGLLDSVGHRLDADGAAGEFLALLVDGLFGAAAQA